MCSDSNLRIDADTIFKKVHSFHVKVAQGAVGILHLAVISSNDSRPSFLIHHPASTFVFHHVSHVRRFKSIKFVSKTFSVNEIEEYLPEVTFEKTNDP